MDITAQIALNSFVLLNGLFLLLPYKSNINILLCLSLSWFLGWGMVGVIDILFVIAGIPFSIIKLSVVSVLALVINVIGGIFFLKIQLPKRFKEYVVLAALVSVAVIVFSLLVIFANYIHYSTDSITNEGLSRIFHNYGVYANGNSDVNYWLFNVRLPFYIAINNIAYLSGIEIFYSFLSITTVMTILLVSGFWVEYKKQIGFFPFLWLFICLGLFATNRLVIFHSFYALSNLTNMAYFSVGILCLNSYKRKNAPFWFILACFFLALTCMIRKEMLIVSLLPYFFALKELRPEKKLLLSGFAVYTITAYAWFFWGFFYLSNWRDIISDPLKTTNHGGTSLVAFCLVVNILAFFVLPKMINKVKIRLRSLLSIVIITTAIALYYFGNDLSESVLNLWSLMFTKKGQWGYFWWLLFIFSASLIVITLFLKFYRKDQKIPFDWYLPSIIISFFIIRIMLYTIFTGPDDDKWNTSGNRVLLHIVPLCVFWMGQVVIDTVGSVRISEKTD